MADYATWNLYIYCAWNPVGYIDPSGHAAIAAGGLAALAELLSNAAVSLGVTALIYKGVESVVAPERSVYKPRIPAVPKTPSVAKPRTRPVTKAHTIPQPRIREYSEHKSKARPSTKDKHEAGQARKKRDQGGEKKKKSGKWKPNPNKRSNNSRKSQNR